MQGLRGHRGLRVSLGVEWDDLSRTRQRREKIYFTFPTEHFAAMRKMDRGGKGTEVEKGSVGLSTMAM